MWLGLAFGLVGLSVCSSGCVRRRLTLRSNPPGARVFVGDEEIGTTPVSTSFTYYGTRKIQLVRDGYETLTTTENFTPPWYEFTPLDFVSENLWPWETRDERVLDFTLVPQQRVPANRVLDNAERLRLHARQGYVTPLPVVPPSTGLPGIPGTVGPGPVPATVVPGTIPTVPNPTPTATQRVPAIVPPGSMWQPLVPPAP